MNWLSKLLNSGLFFRLRMSFAKYPDDAALPFCYASDIDEVIEYFDGYDESSDPYLRLEGPLPGFCFLCRKKVRFEVEEPPPGEVINWRETLKCPHCHLINRWRGCLHLFETYCEPAEQDRIYITEALTPVHHHLSEIYPNLASSEFTPRIPTGRMVRMHSRTFRNEDITKLTFDDRSFDIVLSFDVLEHVPDYCRAIQEFYRVLDNEGYLVLSAPFSFQKETQVRAVVNDAGEVEHLMEPCYHGDPLLKTGVLAFYDFGMDVLDELRTAGFSDCFLVCHTSNDWGYPSSNTAFVARKYDQP
jgi:hypothetical protein